MNILIPVWVLCLIGVVLGVGCVAMILYLLEEFEFYRSEDRS